MSKIKLLVVVIFYSVSQPSYVLSALILILFFLTSHTKRVLYKTVVNARDLPDFNFSQVPVTLRDI